MSDDDGDDQYGDDDGGDQYGDYDDDNADDKVFLRRGITWPECLAHWQSAQSLSKAASRLRPFLLLSMRPIVSFLLHLAISNMGHEKQLYKRRVVHLGRARLGERGGGLKTPTLG